MIISFTGHRKILNQYYPHKVWNPICTEVVKILEDLKPDMILSGMALGFDSVACEAAIALNIPFKAIIPFKGQETAWPYKSQKRYNDYLTKAQEVIILSEGKYEAWKMETRNRYLVDNCDMVLACYDDSQKGGTGNCVRYAQSKNKEIKIIDPRNFYEKTQETNSSTQINRTI
jgi:uncharacterized phage-like protein YoqJ